MAQSGSVVAIGQAGTAKSARKPGAPPLSHLLPGREHERVSLPENIEPNRASPRGEPARHTAIDLWAPLTSPGASRRSTPSWPQTLSIFLGSVPPSPLERPTAHCTGNPCQAAAQQTGKGSRRDAPCLPPVCARPVCCLQAEARARSESATDSAHALTGA